MNDDLRENILDLGYRTSRLAALCEMTAIATRLSTLGEAVEQLHALAKDIAKDILELTETE